MMFRQTSKKSTACRFCNECLPEDQYSFKYWKVLHNNFPYDMIASEHDLLIPRRHFTNEIEMDAEERAELTLIKTEILPKIKTYDTILENFMRTRSVKHYHIHLLKLKSDI